MLFRVSLTFFPCPTVIVQEQFWLCAYFPSLYRTGRILPLDPDRSPQHVPPSANCIMRNYNESILYSNFDF